MRRRTFIIPGLLALILLAACARSSDPAARAPADVAEVFHSQYAYRLEPDEPEDMGYLLWYPEGYDSTGSTAYPLLIFLHGSGGNGDNVEVFQDVMRRPAPLEDRASRFPYLVLMPQAPTGTDWTDELPVLNELLDHVIETYPVDESRIYLTGYSMGGAGVWGWGSYAPERFAALVPIAGYWNTESATFQDLKICNLKDLPVYAFHSKEDMNVAYVLSSGLINTLEQCNGSGEITFKTLRGLDHYTTLSRAMGNMKMYRWLDEQSLAE